MLSFFFSEDRKLNRNHIYKIITFIANHQDRLINRFKPELKTTFSQTSPMLIV